MCGSRSNVSAEEEGGLLPATTRTTTATIEMTPEPPSKNRNRTTQYEETLINAYREDPEA